MVVATDPHEATAELSFDVTVLPTIRDDFDADDGLWAGITGLEATPGIVSIRDGHLFLSVSRDYVLQYATRDVGTFGPNWMLSARIAKTPQVCGGIMAFPEPLDTDRPPRFVWSIDLDPFGGWFVTLYVEDFDDWLFIEEGFLPINPNDDGFVEIALGYTENNLLYGYAHGDHKLFEFDMNTIEGLELPPNTIELMAVAGQPCEVNGRIQVDWIEASIREESSH